MRRLLALTLALNPLPAFAEEIGLCRFDRDTLSFAGNSVEQAQCLLQRVDHGGALVPQPLPDVLRHLLSSRHGPNHEQRDAALAELPELYAAYARQVADYPVSSTPDGQHAAYFVIHDTSTPFLGNEAFPANLDQDARINALYVYAGNEPVAHVFLNRQGEIWAGHDFSEPWRATKLESYVIGAAAKGRFLHIETVQPRRYAPGSTSLGDTLAPSPGFSPAQYRMLAALYVYASARAGRWLIPAFHAAVDAGIPEAHDDPQNFVLEDFAGEVERLVKQPRRN